MKATARALVFSVAVFASTGFAANLSLSAAAETVASGEPFTITEASQIWTVPAEQKRIKLPLRIEARVNYVDPMWRLLWLETNGVNSFLPMSGNAPRMPPGGRVLIEGSIVPEQGLSAALAKVTVLQEYERVHPISANGRINELEVAGGRVVAADAYVDAQQFIDDDHLRLLLIIDDRPVIGWLKPTDPHALPNLAGKFVHVEGVYSGRFDPTHTEMGIELWIGRERDVKVTDTLETDRAFEMPPTPIERLFEAPPNTLVLVRGRAQANAPGSSLVIRDATGQVLIRTFQQLRVPIGTEVEAIGRVGMEGPKWVLRSALFRRAAVGSGATGERTPKALETVDQIRQLSLADAARGRRVKISGVVTWAMADENFFFLQDVTGGIRVRFDRAKFVPPALTKAFTIEGVTYSGAFAPAIDLASAVDLGSMNAPEPRRVMYEQAVTGKEDGEWVEMRGFLERIDSEGDLRFIHVTAPAGDFVARLLSPVNLNAHPGSLIRVRGVCEATAGRLTGVLLRVPFLHSINIEEEAPADFFDLPPRTIKDLRPIEGTRELARVRITGTVLSQVPGRTVYIEEDGLGLQLLTRQTIAMQPGDQIDAVGILGREGARIVLRETTYRKIGEGTPPAPIDVKDPARPVPELDARLARVRGWLIDVSAQSAFTRLTLQSGASSFEATLEQNEPSAALPAIGSELSLTGIYQLAYDDSRQTRGFSLRLRSPADIAMTRSPRLWTLQRALLALGALGACTFLGVGWIAALRRRVAKQTEQMRAQLERQARLEAGAERAARLESLGMLAGGIAHDFNNLLTIIVGNISLAKLEDRRTAEMQRCFDEIERVTVRARSLTQQLLTFAKGGEPLRVTVAVEPIVRDAAQRAIARTQAELAYSVAPELWPAHADKDQLAQIVHSLVTNAVQAMPNGGVIRVALANETIAAGQRDGLAAGRYVRLTVSDTGEGISRDILPKIFDPYFSTRKGSPGLGLATVYSIVKRHQGYVDLQSTVGAGTHVDVWLPVATAKITESAPPSPAEPVSTREAAKAARILLLEDEESIRRIAATMLKRNGHEVVAVASGADAVKEFGVAQANGKSFELLILDLTVPGGLGGKEVIELIRKLDPQVPAIVSSGYSSDPVMANFERYGFQASVPKPYEVAQLIAAVDRLLS
jgi:signal transduction histidine kinase/ActR/RegA family two-component response regulator